MNINCNHHTQDFINKLVQWPGLQNQEQQLHNNCKNCRVVKIEINEITIDSEFRKFLLLWFRYKGFKTLDSFSSLVLHFYPEITFGDLKQFWDGIKIDLKVLRSVEYTRQIIGE
jgi:hypothetical protein